MDVGGTTTAPLNDGPSTTAIGRPGDATGVGFRGDIDGLRAVAIVLIVGYHVGLASFPGGFIW